MLNIFLAIVSLIFFTTSCQTIRGDKPLAEKVIKSDPSTNLTLGLVQMTVREGASKNDIISSLGSPNMVTSLGSKNDRQKLMWKKHLYLFFYVDGNYIMI